MAFERRRMLNESESGFTFVELLVVILIIAILAAIAIPVFLNQRKKGWGAQAESAVRNMASAEQAYLTGHDSYTASMADLVGGTKEGFVYSSADVDPSIVSASDTTYCVRAASVHDPSIVFYYTPSYGAPSTTACT